MRFLAISLVGATLLASCAAPSKQPAGLDAAKAQEKAESLSQEAGKQPDSRPEPAAVEQKAPLACPQDKAQAQDIAQHLVVTLLDDGKEAEAKSELQKALCMDRNNVLAQSLLSQITEDPNAYFAEKYAGKSFKYSVRPGDTLSKIAGAYLGDTYQFYMLARYNGIAVPKSVHAGQVIKVPGTLTAVAPPPLAVPSSSTPPEPTQVERLYQAGMQALVVGEKDKAYDLFMQSAKLDPKDMRPRAAADKLRAELVAIHDRKAREANARQDLDAAISEWNRVLELDPTSATALRERQRAVDLQKMTKDLPDKPTATK